MAKPTKTEDDQAVQPLAVLAKEVGKADAALLASHTEGTSDADLVEVGKTILSARIVTDASRLYGEAWAFWQHASDAQKKTLRGFSQALLAVAVHQALKLEELDAAHASNTDTAAKTREQTDRAAAATFTAGLSLRDQGFDALRDAAGHDEARLAEVEGAKGTAGDGAALGKGLEGLAKVLHEWLKKGKTDKGLSGRLMLGSLDEGYAKELEDGAKKVRATAAAAKARPAGGKVTQGELDRADGLNVMLLGQVIRAFDSAHDRDPTIPRLVPISTRRLFSRSSKKKAAGGGGEGAPPATGGGTEEP
jgi:hypothetical protein